MLILLQREGRPKFHININLDIFIAMFSIVLATVEIFEYSNPHSMSLNVAHLPKRLSTPGTSGHKYVLTSCHDIIGKLMGNDFSIWTEMCKCVCACA
jgi:hypothetical protein